MPACRRQAQAVETGSQAVLLDRFAVDLPVGAKSTMRPAGRWVVSNRGCAHQGEVAGQAVEGVEVEAGWPRRCRSSLGCPAPPPVHVKIGGRQAQAVEGGEFDLLPPISEESCRSVRIAGPA